ncbi:GpE family phage tail protein [Asticcacaulis solisilvae]
MSDIAVIFHWDPEKMEAMSLEDLSRWREKAVSRWNQMNRTEK